MESKISPDLIPPVELRDLPTDGLIIKGYKEIRTWDKRRQVIFQILKRRILEINNFAELERLLGIAYGRSRKGRRNNLVKFILERMAAVALTVAEIKEVDTLAAEEGLKHIPDLLVQRTDELSMDIKELMDRLPGESPLKILLSSIAVTGDQ